MKNIICIVILAKEGRIVCVEGIRREDKAPLFQKAVKA